MVVSDELPKASSKERGGGGKVNFFFENLSLVPETREVMEHFKLVFGSGTSDLAKIRPLKNWTPAINWRSSLYGNFHLRATLSFHWRSEYSTFLIVLLRTPIPMVSLG